ncbi:hypothetical protein EPN52_01805 [bacterium]|nr:MAG: hypothetical protein EPN52_01805 [bacterium]
MTNSGRFDGAAPMPARCLGLTTMHVEPGSVAISGRVDPEYDDDPECIHSLTSATLDVALDRAVRSTLDESHASAVIELTVRYARSFNSANGNLICRASVTQLSEHLGTASAHIVDADENRFVEADATCMIRRI